MISPKFFIEALASQGIDFFAGVPDSLLKSVCAYITETLPRERNVTAANEGGAMGIAAGYHLATGRIPAVYMQNSGEGNAINPLASLTDREVYGIPVLLLIGWRGRPGVQDEPQHVKQGEVTTGLLNVMGIGYTVLSKDESTAGRQIRAAADCMRRRGESYALVIEEDTFAPCTFQDRAERVLPLSREEAIETVVASLRPDAAVVSTTGMISRELFEIRERRGEGHGRDFLTVGGMGHASQIALGIALQRPGRPVWCFDGDGSVLMHMGGMAITASMRPGNYVHAVFNNGAHDSVGGQPTAGFFIDLPGVARAVGYRHVRSVTTREGLEEALDEIESREGPSLLEVKVRRGSRRDLGRPTTTPVQNKEALMTFLRD